MFVTGPSGAGRSSALKILEDCGFDVVDNLPLHLVPALMDDPAQMRPIALGIDVRNRDFSINGVFEALAGVVQSKGLMAELLYLDCSMDVLLRRFSETRRRHPLAPDDRPAEGIMREMEVLRPLRERAEHLIDTTELNVHQLREELERWFAPGGRRALSVSVQSFSYKRGLPRNVDMVFDCRFLTNPHWVAELRQRTGRDPAVAECVMSDPRFADFASKVVDLSLYLLPAYRDEGKSYLSIAFGCTGGQHRSVVMAEMLGLRLAEADWRVSIRHRELDLRAKEEV